MNYCNNSNGGSSLFCSREGRDEFVFLFSIDPPPPSKQGPKGVEGSRAPALKMQGSRAPHHLR